MKLGTILAFAIIGVGGLGVVFFGLVIFAAASDYGFRDCLGWPDGNQCSDARAVIVGASGMCLAAAAMLVLGIWRLRRG